MKKPSLTSLISLHTYSKACKATLRQSEVEYTVNMVAKLFWFVTAMQFLLGYKLGLRLIMNFI